MGEIFLDIHKHLDRTSLDPERHEIRIKCTFGTGAIEPVSLYFPAYFNEGMIARAIEHNAIFLEEDMSPWDLQKPNLIKLYNTVADELRK